MPEGMTGARSGGTVMERLLIALDGGGTKTELVLFTPEGTVLERVLAPGSNPNDFGWERTEKALETGLTALLEQHGGLQAPLSAAFAGIAGCMAGDNKNHLQQLMRRLIPGAAHIVADSDVVNALSSGVGMNDGCVVIAGTGSVGFARTDGKMIRVGGWGYLFDRGGSGFDLGRDAVMAALYALDGRGPETVLTEMIEEQLKEPLEQSIQRLYREGRPAIAVFAPLVFAAAKRGDGAALKILDTNAAELARLMNAMGRQLKQDVCDTVLAGSLFRAWDQLSPRILPRLEKEHRFRFPQLPPVYGAALEALRAAGLEADPSFEAVFSESLGSACARNMR